MTLEGVYLFKIAFTCVLVMTNKPSPFNFFSTDRALFLWGVDGNQITFSSGTLT